MFDDARRARMEEAARRKAAFAVPAPVPASVPPPAAEVPAAAGASAGSAWTVAGLAPVRGSDLDVGPILSKTWQVFRECAPSFLAIALLIWVPFFVLSMRSLLWAGGLGGPLPGMLFALVPAQLTCGAVTLGVLERLRGREASAGDGLGVLWSRLLPVLGGAVVQLLAVAFGMLMCVAPAMVLAPVIFVATPAAVVEKAGVWGALNRSTDLTAGHRWRIFGVFFVLSMIFAALHSAILAFAIPFSANRAARFVVQSLDLLALLFYGVLVATAQAVVYYRLRIAKESIDSPDLASVFD